MDYGFIPNKQLTQGAKVEKCRVLTPALYRVIAEEQKPPSL